MPRWFNWKWLGVVALALVAVMAFSACGDDDNEASKTPAGTTSGGTAVSKAPLKIGALLSFTGDLGDFGQPIFNGAQMAVDEINAGGGVLGNNVELVRADDGTSPQQGVSEAQRLVDVEKVQAIVGALASGVSLQVAETVTGPKGVLQISPASTSPGLTKANDSDFLFRTTISDAAQGIMLARLAQDEALTKVCTMYINSAYGQGLSNAFAKNFKLLGGTVTAEVPHESAQATYASELQKCAGADALAAMAYPQSAGVFLREAKEGNTVPKFLFVDGTKDDKMLEALGWQNFDGVRGTAPSSLPTAEAKSFNDRYKAAYGELPPRPFIKEAYDAVYLVALAAEQAGSTDSKAIRDSLRKVADGGAKVTPGTDGFKAAVADIKANKDIDFDGTTGPLTLDDAGDPSVGAIEWWHVDAAKKTLVTDKKWKVNLLNGEVTDITEVSNQ